MKLEVVHMPEWKSKVLNAVAWVLGIRGEDVWCVTLSKDAVTQLQEEGSKDAQD